MFGYCSSFTTLIVSLVSLTFEWYQTKIVWIEYPDIAHVNPKHATMIKALTAILSNLLYQGNPWSVVISVHRLSQSRQIAVEKLISIKWHFLWHSIYNIAFISIYLYFPIWASVLIPQSRHFWLSLSPVKWLTDDHSFCRFPSPQTKIVRLVRVVSFYFHSRLPGASRPPAARSGSVGGDYSY